MPIDTSITGPEGGQTGHAKERIGRRQDHHGNLLTDMIVRVLDRLTRIRVKKADQVRDRGVHHPVKPAYEVFVLHRNPVSVGVLLPVPGEVD